MFLLTLLVFSGCYTQPVSAGSTPPLPTATAQPAADVTVYTVTVSLPTYPFRDYLIEQTDPVYNMPVYYFNRPAYEAQPRTPTPVDYTGVVLENKYLRLTFLPQLGGRLYSAVIKATDQEVFYHNPVVKPSRYGGLQPYEANWWLATGGMEWAYPTQEHGYRFGVPWAYQTAQTAAGASITLSDVAPNRVGLAVTVSLPADSASFTVSPVFTNSTTVAVPAQIWANAALALSSASMSPRTQFVIPTDVITIHSRGDLGWTIPAAGLPATWPRIGALDLRDYRQWANYLGFFVDNSTAPFMGAVNPALKLGMVRLPQGGGRAGKLFAFGSGFTDRSYTDDNSQYFEIWGGANATFGPPDDITVAPGGAVSWTERWWPLAGLPGLTWANNRVAVAVTQTGSDYTLAALVSQPTAGRAQVRAGSAVVLDEAFSADPDAPLRWKFSAPAGPITLEITDSNHAVLLSQPIN